MNRGKVLLADSPIRVKPYGNRLAAPEPLPKKEEVKFKIFYMEYSILILTDALNQQKEQLSRIERVVVNDIRFEKIQQNSKQYTMYLIADLESAIKILNDSSAPIRPDEADKESA